MLSAQVFAADASMPLPEALVQVSNRWSYVARLDKPAMTVVAQQGTNVLPLILSWFTDEAWQRQMTNALFLQERGLTILGRMTNAEAEAALLMLSANTNVTGSKFWWIPHGLRIQLKKKEAERRLASVLNGPTLEQNTVMAKLTQDLFAWTVKNKLNMWNEWSQDAVIEPLRALGTHSVPWISLALKNDTLPHSLGGSGDHVALAAAVLGYSGTTNAIPPLRALLADRAPQRSSHLHGSLQSIADALLRLGDTSGVEFAVKQNNSEVLDHLVGGTLLKGNGIRLNGVMLEQPRYTTWTAWWQANKNKPIAEWERGFPTHVH